MSRVFVEEIRSQTKIMFFNIEVTLRTCNPELILFGMPIWKHLYHTLHSCDQWYINPEVYTEPPFHEKDLNSLDVPSQKVLSRAELMDYFQTVQKKINSYLDGLSDEMLPEKPENCPYTRFTLILGQIRHFMCHLGNINCTTMEETGRWPLVVGTKAYFPDLNDESSLYE